MDKAKIGAKVIIIGLIFLVGGLRQCESKR